MENRENAESITKWQQKYRNPPTSLISATSKQFPSLSPKTLVTFLVRGVVIIIFTGWIQMENGHTNSVTVNLVTSTSMENQSHYLNWLVAQI